MHDAEYLVPGNNRVPRQLQLPGGHWWSRHREAKTQGPSRVGLLTKLPGPNGVVKSCSSSSSIKKKRNTSCETRRNSEENWVKSLSLSRSYILQ